MQNEHGNIYVLIVAAGCSRRMKQFKPLLPLGKSCILESAVSSFQRAGLTNLAVVVGYRKQALLPVLRKYNALVVENPAYDETDMLESIKLGLNALPPETEAVFLCPTDVALVSPHTIRALMRTYQEGRTSAAALIPTYHGQTGHPPLFGKDVMNAILDYQGDRGVRGVLEDFQDKVQYLELPDPEIVEDADLPKDYERMQKALENQGIPDAQVCEDIWNYVKTPEHVRLHCRAVEKMALELAEEYFQKNPEARQRVNKAVLSASALLHDMLKTVPGHAEAAAGLLEEMGYSKISPPVRFHRVLPANCRESVNEITLLYLADRLIMETTPVSLEKRYAEKLRRYASDPRIQNKIQADKETAQSLYKRIRGENL